MTIRNIFLLLIAALLGACKDKDTFTIKGELSHAGQFKKAYLLAADSAGVKVVDSTNLSEDGAFQFKGMTPYPNLYKLRIGGLIFDLIAQNGDVISFRTDLKDTTSHASSISGSQATLELQQWDKINDQYAAKSQQLLERYQVELQRSSKKEDSLLKAYSAPYQEIAGDLSKAPGPLRWITKLRLPGFMRPPRWITKNMKPG